MKIFLDTANLEQIAQANEMGVIDGVTTNPTIISKENIESSEQIKDHYKSILKLGIVNLSAEVIATDHKGMMKEAKALANLSPNIVVKIPCTVEGIKTVKKLSLKGISTNCTLIFSLQQCLMAMKAGATYVSPFIGRLEDQGDIGINLIADAIAMKNNYGFNSQIICTSVRNLHHIKECIRLGADIITCTYDFLPKLINHPLTETGLDQFLSDYNKAFPPHQQKL